MASFRNRKKYKKPDVDNNTQTFKLTKLVKRELLLTAISIFGVLLVSMGSAFSVFTSFSKSTNYNQVSVGNLNITYSATSSGTAYGDTLTLASAYPMSDADGGKSKPYRFTLTNSGTLSASYTVAIKDDQDMITSDKCSSKQMPKTAIKISVDSGTAALLSAKYNSTSQSYIIATGTLAAGATKTFDVRMWISTTAGNDVLGTHFHGKLVVDGKEQHAATATTSLSILQADLKTVDGASETVIEPSLLEGKLQVTPSDQPMTIATDLPPLLYDVVLSPTYQNAVVKFSVPDLHENDSVTTTFYDGTTWIEIPSQVLGENVLQVTLPKTGTLSIQKNE